MTRPWDDQSWFAPYQRAVNEMNTDKLPERIQTAQKAIEARMVELARLGDAVESEALHDALQVLCLLREFRSISAAPIG